MVRNGLVWVVAAAVFAGPLDASAQYAPPPAPAPQQVPTYRFTLVDGRIVDAQLVSADASNYTIQTPAGIFTLARSQVTAMVMLRQYQQVPPAYPAPATTYTPPPGSAFTPVPQGPPVGATMLPPEPPRRRAPGVTTFLLLYGTTALVAAARNDTDADANLGFVPVIGPLLWAGVNDEDDLGEDGWDWLAVTTGIVQGVSLYWAIRGLPERDIHARRGMWSLSPAATRSYQGLALTGSF